jgi:hypothetical protein
MGRPTIRANAPMQLLIDKLASASLPPVSGRILRYLDDGVVESEGCVLLKALQPAASAFEAQRHHDRTGYECAVNRLDFDAAAKPDHALATALTYAGQLVDMLDRCGAAGPFRVILTHQPRDGSCAVRFHRLRENESWRAEPADSGRDAAILVLDCAAPPSAG